MILTNETIHVLINCVSVNDRRKFLSTLSVEDLQLLMMCLFCGTPTNLYSHTPMFNFQPVCNGCRNLRNKTHWDNIREALAPRTWIPKLWTDKRNMKKRMNGGL